MEKLDLLDQNMFNFVALTSKIFSDLVKNVVDSDNMSLKAKEIVQLSRNIEQDIKNFDLDKEKPEELDLEFERLRLIKFEKLEEFDQIRREADKIKMLYETTISSIIQKKMENMSKQASNQ